MASGAIKAKNAGYEKLHAAILSRPHIRSEKRASESRKSSPSNRRSALSTLPDDLQFLSAKQAMRLLRVGRLRLGELLEEGELGIAYDLRGKGSSRPWWRISHEGVKQFLRSGRGKSKAQKWRVTR